MLRKEFLSILASELAMHGVPESCTLGAIELQYAESGVVFLLTVLDEKGKAYGLSNIVTHLQMENFRNPLEFIQKIAGEFRSKLECHVKPLVVPASMANVN